MSRPYDHDARRQHDREAAREAKLRDAQQQADVQQVMKLPAMRRILHTFLNDVGVDGSPFATNAMAQSHAIGLQDAGKWWLNLIRTYCPEKEAIIRAEGQKIPPAEPGTEDDEHE